MQRRRFLRLTGLSTAALFFNRLNAGTSDRALNFPTSVFVWRDGQWMKLAGAREHWTLGSLVVDLRHTAGGIGKVGGKNTAGGMAVDLHAPGVALEMVKLSWDLGFSASAKYLGDHWERSYGDLSWERATANRKAPWYLLVHDGDKTHGFGVKTGAKCFAYWQVGEGSAHGGAGVNKGRLELVLDTHSGAMGVELRDRVLHAAEIVTIEGGADAFETDTRLCRLMCDKPLLPKKPVYGINDWYFAYGNSSKELILETTRSMSELATDTDNRPFSVVDDGWELGADFKRSNSKFGDMSLVAAEIKKTGMRPGLWTRPLLATAADRDTLLIPLRKGEGGKDRYLDPSIPENLQRIGETIRLYREWGFDMIKHDYSTYDSFGRWGFQMKEEMTAPGWYFYDRSKTNAEILLGLYEVIRKEAGPMYLIGCNTVSHLSAGIFELNRIGDDTSGKEWERVVKYGVNTMGFRLPQHNTFYAADGDCVGVTTMLPWAKNKQWMQLLAESGAPLFISAQPEATGAEQKAFIRECFTKAARVQPTGVPLDWMENPRPAKWKLNGRVVNFDWS